MKLLKNSCFLIAVIYVVIKQTGAVAVTQTDCADGGDECDSIPKAVCDTGKSKCKCTTGYTEDTTNTDTCVKVLGLACTGNTACSSDEHSLCKNNICACADDYEEKNDICTQTVSSITCTASGKECENVPNAECDEAAKKCKCSDGHVMNVDVCAAENAAATLRIGTATLLLLVILAVCN